MAGEGPRLPAEFLVVGSSCSFKNGGTCSHFERETAFQR